MPLNRFITFVKPYLNLVAAAIAAWLVAKANVLGISGLGNGSELQTGIAAGLTFIATQAVTQLGDLKWLKGHHLALVGDAQVQAAVLAAPSPAFVAEPGSEGDVLAQLGELLPSDGEEFAIGDLDGPPRMPVDEPPVQPSAARAEALPGDDEEFAAPPPDETNMPVQPSQVELEGALA